MIKNTFYYLKSQYMSFEDCKENSSKYKFWLACKTYSFHTACGSHLCKSLQDLQKIRNLNKGDFELFSASGESIQVEAVGTKVLKLPSKKILKLKTCYYIPNIIINIISIPLLLKQGFEIIVKNNGCSIYFCNEYYASTFIDNDLIFFLLNDNVLYIDNMKKKERGCECHIPLALLTWLYKWVKN